MDQEGWNQVELDPIGNFGAEYFSYILACLFLRELYSGSLKEYTLIHIKENIKIQYRTTYVGFLF